MAKASGELSYGRYVIRTFASAGKVRARAFLGSKVVADVGDTEGPTLDAAVDPMRVLLDGRDRRQRAAREDGVPTADEFADAFARLSPQIGEHHWLMLKALLAAPGRTLTAAELAAAAGYPNYASANEKFGKLARMVAEDLGYRPDRRPDGTVRWTTTFAVEAHPGGREDDGLWRWTMRPEVAECLLRLTAGAAAA